VRHLCFTNVKGRHIVQSLAEAYVFGADKHLYISLSKQSATVFRMKCNVNLLKKVLDEVNNLYYTEILQRPTKIEADSRTLKAKFLKLNYFVRFRLLLQHSNQPQDKVQSHRITKL